jgi:hypothetical protein
MIEMAETKLPGEKQASMLMIKCSHNYTGGAGFDLKKRST